MKAFLFWLYFLEFFTQKDVRSAYWIGPYLALFASFIFKGQTCNLCINSYNRVLLCISLWCLFIPPRDHQSVSEFIWFKKVPCSSYEDRWKCRVRYTQCNRTSGMYNMCLTVEIVTKIPKGIGWYFTFYTEVFVYFCIYQCFQFFVFNVLVNMTFFKELCSSLLS